MQKGKSATKSVFIRYVLNNIQTAKERIIHAYLNHVKYTMASFSWFLPFIRTASTRKEKETLETRWFFGCFDSDNYYYGISMSIGDCQK